MNRTQIISELVTILGYDKKSFFQEKFDNMLSTNVFWGTSVLYDISPYELERKGLERGKKIDSPLVDKGNKFCHYLDENENISAIYGYLPKNDEPNQYIFIEINDDIEYVFSFNNEKKLDYVQISVLENGQKKISINMDAVGNYIEEEYKYDDLNNLVSISRNHKNESIFKNTTNFPHNICVSTFVFEYAGDDPILRNIKWDANTLKEMRVIYTHRGK